MAFKFEVELRGEGGTGILAELRSEGVPIRAINRAVTIALKAAAEVWIRKFLPLHFGPAASSRYGYRKRTPKTQRIKSERPTIAISGTRISREMGKSIQVPNPNFGLNPPVDWVHTGELRSFVLRRAASGQMLERVTAPMAATRLQAIIRVPYPHPVRPEYAKSGGNPEIVKLLPSEQTELSGVASRAWREVVKTLRGKPKKVKLAA